MERKYGIFMLIGESTRFGDLTGAGLVKMNLSDFNSEQEAIDYINEEKIIPSNQRFLILSFIEYIKSTHSA